MNKLLMLLLVLNIGLLQAQYTQIPDQNFEQALIDLAIDSENTLDGRVLTNDLANVEFLILFDTEIYDLTGIEDFVNLTYLKLENNNLSQLNLSQVTSLEVLEVNTPNSIYGLETIDITGCVNLKELYIFNYGLRNNIDLSNNINLEKLWIWGINFDVPSDANYLPNIDLSSNTKLTIIKLIAISLESLDVSNQPNLSKLYVNNNNLENLDISNNTNLKFLVCPNNSLTNLDLSNNNQLEELDISNPYFDFNFNYFTLLDLSNNPLLRILVCSGGVFNFMNYPNTLDLSNNINLEEVYLRFNGQGLEKLNLTNGNNGNIAILDLRNCSSLTCVQLDNQTIVDIANNDQNNWWEDNELIYSIDCITANLDEFKDELISIYPNPTKDDIYINLTNQILKNVSIYTVLGKKIGSSTSLNINVSSFKKGVYFIKVLTTNNKSYIKKVVKI